MWRGAVKLNSPFPSLCPSRDQHFPMIQALHWIAFILNESLPVRSQPFPQFSRLYQVESCDPSPKGEEARHLDARRQDDCTPWTDTHLPRNHQDRARERHKDDQSAD